MNQPPEQLSHKLTKQQQLRYRPEYFGVCVTFVVLRAC